MFCQCGNSEPDGIGYCRHCGRKCKTAEQRKIEEMIEQTARAALADGVEICDEVGGAVHHWVLQNVVCSPGALGAIVMLTAWKMADLKAQEEGYTSATDRAYKLAKQKLAKEGDTNE